MRIDRRCRAVLLAVALTVGATAIVPASVGAAPLSFGGCVANSGLWGCANPPHDSLAIAYDVAVSPDGQDVYAASGERSTPSLVGNAVTQLQPQPDGQLVEVGCVSNPREPAPAFAEPRGCTALTERTLTNAKVLAVSPDDRNVYALATGGEGGGGINVLARAADGSLSPLTCLDASGSGPCGGKSTLPRPLPADVAVSPDGANVYVTAGIVGSGGGLAGTLLWFNRAADGTLAKAGCIAQGGVGGCAAARGGALAGTPQIAVSPDGESAYLLSTAGGRSGSMPEITIFSRGADGGLSEAGCMAPGGADGCTPIAGEPLAYAARILVSPDGASVYVAADTAVGGGARPPPR
jgi:DNA-binding beta-propeller fold protein YncE